jgi:hypothetical protein
MKIFVIQFVMNTRDGRQILGISITRADSSGEAQDNFNCEVGYDLKILHIEELRLYGSDCRSYTFDIGER